MRINIKSQAVANFVSDLNSPIKEDSPSKCVFSMDDASNVKGGDAWIVHKEPCDIVIKVWVHYQQ